MRRINITLTIISIIFISTSVFANYTITISPVYKDPSGHLFVNTDNIYGKPLQTSTVGIEQNEENVVKPTFKAYVKSKVCLIATVKKDGQPVPGAEIIWMLNDFQKGNYGQKTGDIVYWGSIKKSYKTGNMLVTTTLEKEKDIYVQPSKPGLNVPFGTARYEKLTLWPGQSYIELVASEKGQTDITAYIPDSQNPNLNTVYGTVVWVDQINPSFDLSITDEGPITFLSPNSEPSVMQHGERYIATFNAKVKHNGGKPVEEILTVQLPDNWLFSIQENSPRFFNSLTLTKNSDKIYTGENLSKEFSITTGKIEKKDVTKKYVSVKIFMEPGDIYNLTVKARPGDSENPTEEQGAKIYNAAAMLINHDIVTQDAITLKHGREVRVEKIFSGLDADIFEIDNSDPVSILESKKIRYRVILKSQDYGSINIKNISLLNHSDILLESMISIKNFKTGDQFINNYFNSKNKDFVLEKMGDIAVLDFSIKTPDKPQLLKIKLSIEFEISKTFSGNIKKSVPGKTTLSEVTTVY